MVVGEIITIGSELVSGHTLDTHSKFISKECSALGLEIHFHTTIGDDWDHLKQTIRLAKSRSSVVFLCGGLGPTEDDLTKEVLADVLGIKLIRDEVILSRIEQYFKKRNRPMTANNVKQAYVFSGGTIFTNNYGTAPGLAVTHKDATFILLPGPPSEMRPMWQDQVVPFLKKEMIALEDVILSRSYRFVEIGESRLENELFDLIQSSKNPLIATYAGEGSCILRFTAKAKDEAEAEELIEHVAVQVRERVGEYLVSQNGETLEEVVVQELLNRGESVAFSEGCTGGLMVHMLSSVPNSRKVNFGGVASNTDWYQKFFDQKAPNFIKEHGAISPEAAKKLAQYTRETFSSDWGVSVTEVTSLDSNRNQPTGIIYFGLARKGRPTRVYQYRMAGSFQRIQKLAAIQGLFLLLQVVRKGE